MIVTIDGPAGAGKSTAAKRLSAELGFLFLDTGAMYRAVTWAVMSRGIAPRDTEKVTELVRSITITVDGSRIFVDSIEVTDHIRTREVTRNIGPIADNPSVRNVLSDLQRSIAMNGDYICEGRDQGTIVFPDAECKFFLIASPEYRAHRRVLELEAKKVAADYTIILKEQSRRDHEDQTRPFGRLERAEDAIEIDTDSMTLDEVVATLKAIVLSKRQS